MSNVITNGDKKMEVIPDRDFLSVNRALLTRLAAVLTAAIGMIVLAGWTFGLLLFRELGCSLAQGYFIARPMEAEVYADWVRNWKQPG